MIRIVFSFIVALVVFGVSWGISGLIYNPVTELAQRGYKIEIAEIIPQAVAQDNVSSPDSTGNIILAENAGTTDSATPNLAASSVANTVDFAALIAKGDVKKGAKIAKKCIACHTFDAGGKNKVGPNLHNIENRLVASNSNFKYSKAMKSKGDEIKKWSADNLFAYLKKPSKFIPKNKMAFAGLKKEKDIANLLAYLRSLK